MLRAGLEARSLHKPGPPLAAAPHPCCEELGAMSGSEVDTVKFAVKQ